MAENKLTYDDIIQPTSAITDAIAQLKELQAENAKFDKQLKQQSAELVQQIRAASPATEQGQATIRKTTAEVDKLVAARKKLAYAQSEEAKELARLQEQIREQNRLNKENIRLADSASDSYNALSVQYRRVKAELNKMSAAERESTEEGKKLEQQARDIYEQMKNLQASTGKMQLNVGNYPQLDEIQGQLANIIGLNGRFGESLMNLTTQGGGFQGFLNSAKTGVAAFGKTLMGLLANPAFLAVAGIAAVGTAFKFWYDYNKGLVEATRLTQQFTGKSGQDLKNYRNEVQAVADTYGKDFREVLQSVNALANQFGISQNEAMNIVRDGFIAGADANGEYLDTLKEYPAYFKEAGLSAEQFVAITAQTAKAGIFSDKGVDAIKEANIRLREMTPATAEALDAIGISSDRVQRELQSGAKTTFDIMQEVSARLSELPPTASEVGTAIADIFGGPGEDAGLQYLVTLKDIELNLDNVKDKAGELGALQEQQLQAQIELSNTISAVFDLTGGTFEELTTKAKVFVYDGLNTIIKGFVDLYNWVVDLYNESIALRVQSEYLFFVLKTGINVVKLGFKALYSNAVTLGKIVKAVLTGNFKEATQIYADGLAEEAKLAKEFANNVSSDFQSAFDNIENGKKEKITLQVETEVETPKDPVIKYNYDVKNMSNQELSTTRRSLEEEKKKLSALKDQAKAKAQLLEIDKAILQIELEQRRRARSQNPTTTSQPAETRTTSTPAAKAKEASAKVDDIELERMKIERERIQLQLQGTTTLEEEVRLKTELLDKERQIALYENSKKPESEKQSVADINAAYDRQAQELKRSFVDAELQQFDSAQKLAQAEFDLQDKTEREKTRFRLQAEKDRLEQVLKLNEKYGVELGSQQTALIQSQIAKIDQEMEKNEQPKDIYDLVGLNLNEEEKAAISSATSFALSQIQSIIAAKVEAANKAVEIAKTEVETARDALDAEIEARRQGYASNVEAAQKELAFAQAQQEKAIEQQRKAQKAQEIIETAQQTSSLITGAASIWAAWGSLPAVAIGLIALMFSSFAAAKIMAFKATRSSGSETYGQGGYEVLHGGSHASGNDIYLGQTSGGKQRRAEGGEGLAIFSKASTQRYGTMLPDIVNAINRGTFESRYMRATATTDPLTYILGSNNGTITDLTTVEDSLGAIRKQGESRTYVDQRGNFVEQRKGVKRRYIN